MIACQIIHCGNNHAKNRQARSGKERFWRDKIERQRTSGLNQGEFCAREGVSSGTFSCWIHILQRRDEELRESAVTAKRAAAKKKWREKSKRKKEPLFVAVGAASNGNGHQLSDHRVPEVVLPWRRINIFLGAETAVVHAIIQALKEEPIARDKKCQRTCEAKLTYFVFGNRIVMDHGNARACLAWN
jgi:hypothetical protein